MATEVIKKFLKLTALLTFLSASALVIFGFYVVQWRDKEITIDEVDRYFVIDKGASLYALADKLNERNIISRPKIWVLYARFTKNTAIKAGEYELSASESPLSILKKINEGDVVEYSVTFVEGMRFAELLATLEVEKKLEQDIDENSVKEALAGMGYPLEHLEGWFYPDTYHYTAGDSILSILVRAHKKMQRVLAESWEKRAPDLPYENRYEALIMASIVEKETGVAYERGEIAGVFTRRLRKNMRLQTDPTVIYGMGEAYKGNITRQDLRIHTPYNTYRINGLPPTPICNPGTAAIEATLNPKEGDSLYFVAKGDGTHYFSSTLEEHNAAVDEYQRNRRSDYRSAPSQGVSKEGVEIDE